MIILNVFRDTFKAATIKGMERLIQIWGERGVFELSFTEKLRKAISKCRYEHILIAIIYMYTLLQNNTIECRTLS